MRILHLLKTSDGAAWAERQMRELVKLGHDIHVALPRGGKLIRSYEHDQIKVHYIDLNYFPNEFWRLPNLVLSLKRLIKQTNPDLVHSHFVNTTLVARLALYGKDIPLLFQVPGPLHLENPFIGKFEIILSRKRDYWCAASEYTLQKYLYLGVKEKKIFFVPYSAEVSYFFPRDKYEMRKKLGFNDKIKLIGMIAYFYPPRLLLGYKKGIKGHEDLIDAIELCLKERKDIYCVMVGGPYNKRAKYYMKRVQKYAEEKCGSHIIFLGERNDIPDILACLDIAVVPSLSENYGGTVEALLMEIPTIATAVGGIPELIKHYKTGFLVPKKSPFHIYKYIMDALGNEYLAKTMAKAGRKYVLNKFNPIDTTSSILEVYKKILN